MENYSFSDFLRAYGKANPPGCRFRKGESAAAWQKRFRKKLLELRGPVPARVDPAVKVVRTFREKDHSRYLLDIAVTRFSSLPAYLLVPDGLAAGEKRPGLAVLHGHDQYGIDSVCGLKGVIDEEGRLRSYALHAVRGGYVVIAPAWWGWTGRDGHLDRVGKNRDRCNVIQMAASMYGFNVLDLHIQDARAALDALVARPEVDPGRIGCIGNSYGGRTAMWLAIFDERVKACVASGCMNTFRERSLKFGACGIQYPYGLLKYGDVPELFSLIAPRPLQLQAGRKDSLITPSDRDMIAKNVRRVYKSLSAEDRFSYVLHEEGHLLLWSRAEPFLRRHLGA